MAFFCWWNRRHCKATFKIVHISPCWHIPLTIPLYNSWQDLDRRFVGMWSASNKMVWHCKAGYFVLTLSCGWSWSAYWNTKHVFIKNCSEDRVGSVKNSFAPNISVWCTNSIFYNGISWEFYISDGIIRVSSLWASNVKAKWGKNVGRNRVVHRISSKWWKHFSGEFVGNPEA